MIPHVLQSRRSKFLSESLLLHRMTFYCSVPVRSCVPLPTVFHHDLLLFLIVFSVYGYLLLVTYCCRELAEVDRKLG